MEAPRYASLFEARGTSSTLLAEAVLARLLPYCDEALVAAAEKSLGEKTAYALEVQLGHTREVIGRLILQADPLLDAEMVMEGVYDADLSDTELLVLNGCMVQALTTTQNDSTAPDNNKGWIDYLNDEDKPIICYTTKLFPRMCQSPAPLSHAEQLIAEGEDDKLPFASICELKLEAARFYGNSDANEQLIDTVMIDRISQISERREKAAHYIAKIRRLCVMLAVSKAETKYEAEHMSEPVLVVLAIGLRVALRQAASSSDHDYWLHEFLDYDADHTANLLPEPESADFNTLDMPAKLARLRTVLRQDVLDEA